MKAVIPSGAAARDLAPLARSGSPGPDRPDIRDSYRDARRGHGFGSHGGGGPGVMQTEDANATHTFPRHEY